MAKGEEHRTLNKKRKKRHSTDRRRSNGLLDNKGLPDETGNRSSKRNEPMLKKEKKFSHLLLGKRG